MRPTEAEYNEVMADAANHAWQASHSFVGKTRTWAYFKARKFLVKAPSALPEALAGKVPFAGTILKSGISAITARLRGARIKKHVFAATGGSAPTVDQTKSLFKAMAELATRLDRGVVKQEMAAEALREAMFELTRTTGDNFPDAFWQAACAVQRLEHYNDKLANRLDDVYHYMEAVQLYATEREADLTAAHTLLKTIFTRTDYSRLPEESVSSPRPSTSSSSGYQRL